MPMFRLESCTWKYFYYVYSICVQRIDERSTGGGILVHLASFANRVAPFPLLISSMERNKSLDLLDSPSSKPSANSKSSNEGKYSIANDERLIGPITSLFLTTS